MVAHFLDAHYGTAPSERVYGAQHALERRSAIEYDMHRSHPANSRFRPIFYHHRCMSIVLRGLVQLT